MTAVCAVSRPRPSPFAIPALILTLALLGGCNRTGDVADTTELAAIGVYSAALSPDARFAVVGSLHHGGSLWRLSDAERLFDWNHQPGEQTNIIAASFSPDARFALTASHQTMVLWNVDSGAAVTYWNAPAEVMDLALPPGARFALLGLANYSAVLFDVQRGGILQTVHHENEVLSVALNETGEIALTGDEAGGALLWNTATGAQLQRWQHADEVVTVALSPDGSRALTVAKYDRAAVWDTASGALLWELPLRATAIKRGKSFTSARFPPTAASC